MYSTLHVLTRTNTVLPLVGCIYGRDFFSEYNRYAPVLPFANDDQRFYIHYYMYVRIALTKPPTKKPPSFKD